MGCRISGHKSTKNVNCVKNDKPQVFQRTTTQMLKSSSVYGCVNEPSRSDPEQGTSELDQTEFEGDEEPVEEDHYVYDVNISCHENQLDWVEAHLLPLLETKLNLRCFLFDRDAPAGMSKSHVIQESIQLSRRTIICFSADYVASSWKQYEAIMVHHVDPLGRSGRFIPIIVEDCELPAKFKGLSTLRWPVKNDSSLPSAKANMRLKFFWTNLLRSLDKYQYIDGADANWWQSY